jgi:branched-subunit amino acid permease
MTVRPGVAHTTVGNACTTARSGFVMAALSLSMLAILLLVSAERKEDHVLRKASQAKQPFMW